MSAQEVSFDEGAADLIGVRVDQFAALRAALDSDRQAWQQDILMTAAVDLVATRELTSAELTRAINEAWATSAVTEVMVEQALLRARELRLVESLQASFSGRAKWRASAGGRRDTEQDRAWARHTMDGFEAGLAEFLDLATPRPSSDKLPRLADLLVEALADGCAGVYEVDAQDLHRRLKPVRYEAQRVRTFIDTKVQPKSVRGPLWSAALAAMDPADPFGNDVIHLIVVGSLLRGLLGRHDLPAQMSLAGLRVLVDTSVLKDLATDPLPAHQQLVKTFELVIQFGGEVIVAEHTLDEIERLWTAADDQRPSRLRSLGASGQVLLCTADNPFVQAYGMALATQPELSWPRFQVGRRNPRSQLESLGVQIRSCPDALAPLVSDAAATLKAATEHPAGRRRGRPAIAADAQSLAMLATWRDDAAGQIPAGAYFLARDTLAPQAYRQMKPKDSHTLVVNPEGLLLFASRLGGGDQTEAIRLVDVVGRSMIREGFLGLASGFTVDDGLTLATLLAENDLVDPADIRLAVQLRLEETFDERIDDAAKAVGLEVIRRRGERRDARARRAEEQADRERTALSAERDRLAAESAAGIAEARREADRRVAEANAEADSRIEISKADAHDRAELARRIAASIVALVVVVAAVAISWSALGIPSGRVVALEGVILILTSLAAVRFCTDRDRSWSSLVLGATLAVGLAAAPLLLP
jgi:hypothetical protein